MSVQRLRAVHVVTQEEADAGVFSMEDVVLPLPGMNVQVRVGRHLVNACRRSRLSF